MQAQRFSSRWRGLKILHAPFQSLPDSDSLCLKSPWVSRNFSHALSSIRSFRIALRKAQEFGGSNADTLSSRPDEEIAKEALSQLRNILGPIPEPTFRTVHRWPRSLPQYEVGHLDRIAELQRLVDQIQGVHLLGNSYRGVGIPDLIRDARAAARAIADN